MECLCIERQLTSGLKAWLNLTQLKLNVRINLRTLIRLSLSITFRENLVFLEIIYSFLNRAFIVQNWLSLGWLQLNPTPDLKDLRLRIRTFRPKEVCKYAIWDKIKMEVILGYLTPAPFQFCRLCTLVLIDLKAINRISNTSAAYTLILYLSFHGEVKNGWMVVSKVCISLPCWEVSLLCSLMAMVNYHPDNAIHEKFH